MMRGQVPELGKHELNVNVSRFIAAGFLAFGASAVGVGGKAPGTRAWQRSIRHRPLPRANQ